MDTQEPDGNGTGPGTGPRSLEQLLLAGLGWVSLGADAVDSLADELARRVGIDRDEMRGAVRDTISSWKAEAESLGAKRGQPVERVIDRLGVVRREELDDLALQLSQLEHRLRLLEQPPAPGS
jgi:polyhydroxyalkanoate synthesis regulator phasin